MLAGFALFPLVIVIPGYVFGWLFDLFDFRSQGAFVRFIISLVLSMAISPFLFFLSARAFGMLPSIVLAVLLTVIFFVILVFDLNSNRSSKWEGDFRFFLAIGMIWLTLTVASLINIQQDGKLYISITSFDQTTRVSIVDAMTRTGVPPVNPGYFPGKPVLINALYYFWYIPCSLVDILGGRLVDARAALNASSIWAGFGLIAVTAFYIHLREAARGSEGWGFIRIGVSLLAVSGLDIIPISMLMLATGKVVGSVDVWNTWIASWAGSLLWVPHHIAALIAGMVAILFIHSAFEKRQQKRYVHAVFAGIGLASAVGLSTWVAFVFFIFWVVWIAALFFIKKDIQAVLLMVFAGGVAIFFSFPFLFGVFHGGNGNAGSPVVFEVRTLLQLESFVKDLPVLLRSLIMLLALPLNYLLELGFFFLAGMYWFKLKGRQEIFSDRFYLSEVLLLAVVLLVGSFMKSTIGSNDLGWRSWLPGQFVLLVWGVDVLNALQSPNRMLFPPSELGMTKMVVNLFVAIGVLTSVTDIVLLRTAWPFMTDEETSRRYFSARLAYEYLRDHVPADITTQNNPFNFVDRPSGLYGTHQMIVSDRTFYGISADDFDRLVREVGILFVNDRTADWGAVDLLCERYLIDILIIEDTDPIWEDLPALKVSRAPLYANDHYALFACGKYAKP